MSIIESKINGRSAEFEANKTAMQEKIAELTAALEKIAKGGPEAARQKHIGRGKLLPRERVECLLDPGTAFLELSPLAAYGMYNDDAPGAGIITGIGRVSGIECVIVCNDATTRQFVFCQQMPYANSRQTYSVEIHSIPRSLKPHNHLYAKC